MSTVDSEMLVSVEREGDTYTGRDGAGVAWTVELRLEMNGSPFREEMLWRAASVVAVAGGNTLLFLNARSGALVKSMPLDDLFGHFGPADRDVLYVLGWRDVIAIDKMLTLLWTAKDVAVDGIIWCAEGRDRIKLSAEMDPPGGWVDVELDVTTGREVARGSRPVPTPEFPRR